MKDTDIKLLQAGRETIKCHDCEEQIFKDEAIEVHERGYRHSNIVLVCQNCRDENYFRCSCCEALFPSDESINDYDGELYCQDCANNETFVCCDCEDRFSNDSDCFEYDDNTLCQRCYNNNYFTCNSCDHVCHNDNACQHDGNYYCEDCINEVEENNEDQISDDDEREVGTVKKLIGEKQGQFLTVNRCIGVEIEAERGNFSDARERIPSVCGVSSDGSLDSTGIEIQTPPASMDKAEKIITDACKALKRANYTGTSACGLHTHIDATDFRDDIRKLSHVVRTVFAAEDLLYSMLPQSRWDNHFCKRLSSKYTFNQFKGKLTPDMFDMRWYKSHDKLNIKYGKGDKYNRTRYCGLNLHSVFYRGTIEFRQHSGTVEENKILRWVGLLLLIVDYAISRYDDKTITALYEMPMGEKKLAKFFRIFKIPLELRKYMVLRIKKFNPGFNWTGNSNYEDDITVGAISRATETLITRLAIATITA